MIKGWLQFNESNSTIEVVEDLFLEIADKWSLENSNSLFNSWQVRKDQTLYSKTPENPITKLFIHIDRKKSIKFNYDLERFYSRLEKFGYKASRFVELVMNNRQKYYHIDIVKMTNNESVQFKHPNDIRVTEEDFLERESKLERERFTDTEIATIKDITDKERSYLGKCQYKLEPGYVNHTIVFETTCGHFFLMIIKCEDEWFLIEERPKYGRGTALSKGFFIADGFDQLCDYLKWYV